MITIQQKAIYKKYLENKMNESELDIRIEAANNEMLPEVQDEVEKKQVDYYQSSRRERKSAPTKGSYGTRPYTKAILKHLEQSPVKIGFKKAQEQIKYLKSIGDKQRAELVRQQYMEDYYLPAVDAAIRLGSKQDVLGSKEVLEQLDSFVILDGIRPNGYTSSFVANMYQDGADPTQSDVEVQEVVDKVRRLCDEGNITSAVAAAKRIKNQIDTGNNIAIPEDYEVIETVAARA